MKFGQVPIEEGDGVILAHAVRTDGIALKKGDVVTPERRRLLAQAGVTRIPCGPTRGRRRRRG